VAAEVRADANLTQSDAVLREDEVIGSLLLPHPTGQSFKLLRKAESNLGKQALPKYGGADGPKGTEGGATTKENLSSATQTPTNLWPPKKQKEQDA
jgi:hypothetical protein